MENKILFNLNIDDINNVVPNEIKSICETLDHLHSHIVDAEMKLLNLTFTMDAGGVKSTHHVYQNGNIPEIRERILSSLIEKWQISPKTLMGLLPLV